MIMSQRLRKFALTFHIASSVGWLGAVMAYLALVVTALTQKVGEMMQVWIALESIGWFAIVPLSFISLLTGLIMSLGTPWGLIRHYWVFFKFLLTLFAIGILLHNMQTVSRFANIVSETGATNFGGLWSQLLHSGGGCLVLLVVTILSVYKPKGLTPYGWRMHLQRKA